MKLTRRQMNKGLAATAAAVATAPLAAKASMLEKPKKTIEIPNGWTTRPYQRDLWEYMAGGGLRACAVWHRRAGKDSTFLNWSAVASHLRKGLYWHLLPTLTQGRKVIWDALDSEGNRVIDQVFPKEIRSGPANNSEMKIPLRGGSIFQVVGSDNIDSLVGANPVGVVFSEYALSNPAAWDLIRPILAENKGWAGFPYCVAPDTFVLTQKGWQQIGEIGKWFPPGFTPLAIDIYGLGGFHKAEQFYKSPPTPVLTIKTRKGYEITCTPVHPVWNGSGWVEAGKLVVGDKLAIQLGQEVFGDSIGWSAFEPDTHGHNKKVPFEPNEDFYYFLGLYAAEGSNTGYNAVISIGDEEPHLWLSKYGFRRYKTRADHSIASNRNLCKLLDWLGCGKGALNKQVPLSVLKAPEWAQSAFLRGYFDGDGCATKRGTVHADSISEALLKTIQIMLLNFGIVSRRSRAGRLAHSKRVTARHLCWRLAIEGADAQLFFEKIGFRLQRKQIRSQTHGRRRDGYSVDIDYERVGQNYFVGLNEGDTKRQFMRGVVRTGTVERLLERRPDPYLTEILERDYRVDEIVSIASGVSEVMDFVIPNTHSFVSNGLISHNTPRGRNHGYRLYMMAKENKDWFCEKLTVDDTGAVTAKAVQADREAGMDDQMILQEYFCSFESAVRGSYYGELIHQMREDDRVTGVPCDPHALVHTGWDLGIGDSTAIWFVQVIGREIHWIDYYENHGKALDHYAALIHSKPYNYGDHLLPHDAEARELGTGKTRVETLRELEIHVKVVCRQAIEDGIHAVRSLLPRSWFDVRKTERGLDCLSQYQRTWDDKNQVFREKPLHDFSSHAADAARTLAMGLDEKIKKRDRPRPTRANSGYRPHRWRTHD